MKGVDSPVDRMEPEMNRGFFDLSLDVSGCFAYPFRRTESFTTTMKRLLCAAGLVCAAGLQADTIQFDLWGGGLSGLNESPANLSTATGGEVGDGIVYDTATRQLSINVVYGLFGYDPLTSDYTASHLHSAPVGENGPVVINLAPVQFSLTSRSGFFQGSVAVTPELEATLLSGGLYMNVHSVSFASGEIRAQLVMVPEPGVGAMLGLGLGGLLLLRRRS